jgi:hypothetical protein
VLQGKWFFLLETSCADLNFAKVFVEYDGKCRPIFCPQALVKSFNIFFLNIPVARMHGETFYTFEENLSSMDLLRAHFSSAIFILP